LGPWLPVSPDNNGDAETDVCLLSAKDDLCMYREVKASYDSEFWDPGISEEHKLLMAHNVWTLVPHSSVPNGRHVIKAKLVFHWKCNEKGVVTRRKVCTVVKGFTQIPGVNDKETYAPVSQLESVRAVLHISASNDWDIDQMVVKTAFLHRDLEEELYMKQPEGMVEKEKEDWVCMLNKTLYSLKQASER
jgi:hypothetical protein